MMTKLCRSVAGVAATSTMLVAGSMAVGAESASRVRIEWGLRLRTPDGAELAANVYHAVAGAEKRRPAILTLTPYGADRYHTNGMYFASHGYTFVVVDVRGRGNSSGEYWPYEMDGMDGSAAIDWITAQPWSNGKIGMWGGSAAGYNQWATLKRFPKGLLTIVPTASAYPGFDLPPSFKNIYSGWTLNWLSSVVGRTLNPNLEGDLEYWTQVFRAHHLAQKPFNQLDDVAGMPSPAFDRWLAHPHLDEYWDSFVPERETYGRIELPVLTITGHYDGVQRGALEFYKQHMQHGSETGKAGHYVVMGPWNHAGTRKPLRKVGGVEFGDHSLVDIDQLHVEWYDWTLRSGPRPAFLADNFNYYVEESDEWRSAPGIDALKTRPERLYLAPDGILGRSKSRSATDAYVYNPRDTRAGALEPPYRADYLLDTSAVVNLFGAGLVYETEPLAEDITLAGQVRAELWIELDVPDTDLELVLYQIRPDGTSVQLAQDQLRVRYRNSLRTPTPAPINGAFRVTLADFQFFARRIAQGSRLRLLVHAPNSIYTQKNFNSGGDVGRESGVDARTARISLHLGGERASYIELPLAAN